jgi:hypothetical protein
MYPIDIIIIFHLHAPAHPHVVLEIVLIVAPALLAPGRKAQTNWT